MIKIKTRLLICVMVVAFSLTNCSKEKIVPDGDKTVSCLIKDGANKSLTLQVLQI
jgi:hypothetical protein